MFASYVRLLHRGRWPLAILFILLFAFSISKAKHLKLKSDFKELLPETFQSVRDLNRIVGRVGGTGSLIVGIESDSPQASIQFGEDLVAKLKDYPPEFINRIEYNAAETKRFFEGNKYLYMDLADIREIHHRIERRMERERLKATGIYLEFETAEETQREFNFEDIREKYKSKTSQYQHYIDGYFFDESEKLMAVVIRPPGAATGIDFSKRLVARVHETISELDPQQYHPSMKVGLTGKFRRVLFEYQTLIDDIVSTASLCVGLVGLVVFFYYRRFRMVLLMAWATFQGTAWAFAITAWKIGYLTTQTAFLGSIIIGNGINYGLILMARYLEERKEGRNPLESLQISFPATLAGTLASSITTSVAFGTLMMTDIRGFSHFGFIGGLGMFLCWIATYTVLPVFLLITEEIWPVVGGEGMGKAFFGHFQFELVAPLASRLPRWSKKIARVGTALTLLSIPLIVHFVPNSLEYDFTRLRMKAKGRAMSEEAELNERVKKIFGASLSPAVLVADRTEDVAPLCREIMRKNALDPPDLRVVDTCRSLSSFIPEDQDAKIEELKEMRQLIKKNTLHFLSPEQKRRLNEFKGQFTARHVRMSDLPESIVANFREKNGDVGKLAYVYTTDRAPLWNGRNLIHFADIIRENRLPNGGVVTGSGDSAIFADILRSVIRDGPRVTVLAFIAVCLVVILIFREVRGSLYILGTLTVGVLLMGGAVALFHIKINFFNFIAIPTTFGIGVDYGCNIYQRYKLEGKGSLPHVLRTTGGTVALCSLTTIIGYLTLIIAKNQALVSFGWIAMIGEITCLATALVFVPAIVIRRELTKS